MPIEISIVTIGVVLRIISLRWKTDRVAERVPMQWGKHLFDQIEGRKQGKTKQRMPAPWDLRQWIEVHSIRFDTLAIPWAGAVHQASHDVSCCRQSIANQPPQVP
jgi:hypothetical protein